MKFFVSLRSTFNWSMIIITILSIGMVGSFWVVQEYIGFSAELTKQKDDYIDAKKTEIKVEVDRVIDYIEYKRATTEQQLKDSIQTRVYEAVAIAKGIYNSNRGEKSDIEIQKMIKEALRPLVFNNRRGYFFIYDLQGNNVLLPFSPHLEGKNLWELKDSKGNYSIQNTSKMIREKGEGFHRWYWYKPGNDKQMFEKIGFSKHFKPYDWWIGTGEYIEDFQRDIQKEAIEWINTIRFGQDGYIFVYDFNGTILAHFMEETIGQNVLQDLADPYGIKIVGELIRISQQEGGGFLEYVGKTRPSTGLRAQKIANSQSVKDWQWTVGAGIYVDSINDVIEVKHKNLIQKIIKNILLSFAIFAFSLIIIGVILRYLSKKTTDHIAVFTRFFEQASTKLIKISDDSVHFSEFKLLARSANQMVDDKKKADEELKSLRNYLANIINSMPSVLIGVDIEGNVTQWNNEAERITSISADVALGQPVTQVFPRLIGIAKGLKDSIITQHVQREHRKSWKEKEEVHYQDVTIYPLITNGVEGAVIRVDDITEQVRIEEMMVQNEKMLSVGGLAAGMAHEINNPLAGVIQNSNVLENRLTNKTIPANIKAAESAGITMESIHEFMNARGIPRIVKAIIDSGIRMASIVENMLNFARKGDSSFSSHNPVDLMDKILELASTEYDLKKKYDFKSIIIQKEYEDDLPMIACEGSKIQQVLLNILNNGAHAMREKYTVGSDYKPKFILRISNEFNSGMLKIEIEDNGHGMEDEIRNKVFEPFFTTKSVGIGTGLGLSVSYFIITDHHKGTIKVKSQPGKGTNFIIRLPIERKTKPL